MQEKENEKIAWERRYVEGTHSSLVPDPFLIAAYSQFVAPELPEAGRALDLAGGVGRHALFLAERGWDVTLLDISDKAIDVATSNAEGRGLRITAYQSDLAQAQLPLSSFDLVVNFFYLERTLFPQLPATLKPGGILMFKTYTREQLRLGGGPTHPMHLLESSELQDAFPGLRTLHYHESVEGKAVAELVARKD